MTTAIVTANPLLLGKGLPPFDQIQPEHVVPAIMNIPKESERWKHFDQAYFYKNLETVYLDQILLYHHSKAIALG